MVQRVLTSADALHALRFSGAPTKAYQSPLHGSLDLPYYQTTPVLKERKNVLPVISEPESLPYFFHTESKASRQNENCPGRWIWIKGSRPWSLSAAQLQRNSPSFTTSSHEAVHQTCSQIRTKSRKKEAKAYTVVGTAFGKCHLCRRLHSCQITL